MTRGMNVCLKCLRDMGSYRNLELVCESCATEKHLFPCETPGCPGDGRYVPPGRGHNALCAKEFLAFVTRSFQEDT